MGDLTGKVALITGGGQGVGLGIALSRAAAGAKVAVFGRTAVKLDATCVAIVEHGGEAIALTGNVKDPEDIIAAVAAVQKRFGGIDILVNNAQEVPLGKLLDVGDEAFVAGFESGPLATLRLMKLVHPIMAARGGGAIINLASSAGVRWDMTGYGAYDAVKQAIRTLTRAAAAEWGRDGIRVLAIAPHAESPGLEGWIARNPDEAKAFFRTIPPGRVGRLKEDIGRAVVSLCSSDMGYLTGATIPLDGGQAKLDC
ncbi:MAG: SDR family oxidoreductase [Alphaproteobacteria bacterium]|nr:SDR family oxidoreductase [Alphaproteobacteria bacterium]